MPNRLITDLTLSLVAAMAEDVTLPKGLRDFHVAQLADLRRRAEAQRRTRNSNPFDRFIQKLEP